MLYPLAFEETFAKNNRHVCEGSHEVTCIELSALLQFLVAFLVTHILEFELIVAGQNLNEFINSDLTRMIEIKFYHEIYQLLSRHLRAHLNQD